MLINSDTDTFKKHFENKLGNMLAPDELGSFILVLANSLQDSELQSQLAEKLESNFSELNNRYDKGTLQGSPDDLTVFKALQKTGIKHYTAWQTRRIDSVKQWQCAYNPLRGLRPERASNETFASLQKPFDENAFHFDKPFLKPEILSNEVFQNTKLQMMYHKFPFAPYHLLIVIEASQHNSQYLDKETHQLAWNLTHHIEGNIPGFAIAYNSLGAGASVNHQHIHGFVDTNPMAVEQSIWIHNGGDQNYPLPCKRLESVEASWDYLRQLHERNQPYHILYREGICFILQRLAQGIKDLPAWLPSVGWYEACGGFNLVDQITYNTIKADEIEFGLSQLQIKI